LQSIVYELAEVILVRQLKKEVLVVKCKKPGDRLTGKATLFVMQLMLLQLKSNQYIITNQNYSWLAKKREIKEGR